MKDILLSICISSYNRGTKCAKLVHDILKIDDDRFNIFICDDCSDNKSLSEILPLQNEKVVLIRNTNNVGACLNWYRTISCGNGKYILHVLDRDDIFVEQIVRLLDILCTHSMAGGYVGTSAINITHKPSKNSDYEIFKMGREAFVTMAGVPIHPTGFLVCREYWLKGKYIKFFYNNNKYGIYPHSYVLGELAIRGDMLHMPVAFWKSVYRGCNRYSHFYAKSNQKEYWWLPDRVIREANCLILYLCPLADDAYKEEFLCRRLREGIYRCTIGYRNTVAKKSEMDRYGLKTSNVSKGKMLLTLVEYKIIFSYIIKKTGMERKCSRGNFARIWRQGIHDIFKAI